ncbi:hypothetical protein AVEN_239411-1 [Araneus ventricosus]|uniref:Uncharacterized protein n=1 Tax=Araneus ventricosus TaxID=182803 RepID=A0A4Y2K4H4_ARAVE|nr:hypothetical protein AVEN_239411-1 [Araneus ventricosus]
MGPVTLNHSSGEPSSCWCGVKFGEERPTQVLSSSSDRSSNYEPVLNSPVFRSKQGLNIAPNLTLGLPTDAFALIGRCDVIPNLQLDCD